MTEIPPPAEPVGRRRPSRRAVLRSAVLVAGLVGIALAVRAGADELDGSPLPSAPALAGVLALAVTSTVASARAWSSLLPTVDRGTAHQAVYVSQLSKYLPIGGIAQAAAQLGLTVSSGVPATSVGGAWVVAVVSAISAAALVGVAVVAVPGAPLVLRAVAVLAVGSLALLHPRVLRWAFGLVSRRIPRLGVDSTHVPAPADVARCLGWTVVNQAAFAAANAVAVTSLVADVPAWQVATGAALAWLLGFLVVVLPGGVGVREAVLAAVVPAPVAALLAGSLAVRLALLAAESMLAAGSTLRRRARERAAPAERPV